MKKLFFSSAVFSSVVFSAAAFTALSSLSYASEQPALEEVFVTSSRMETSIRQVGAAVSVVTLEDMTLMAYPSLAEILRNEVGVTATNSGGAGKQTTIRIRGEEGYRTLFLIDGVEVSDPTGTQVGVQAQHLLNGGEFERIEILRGPQGFAFGADAGGVVNIFTREAEPGLGGQVRAESGKFGTQNLSGFFAAGGDKGSVFLSGAKQKTDGFNARSDDNSGELDGYDNRSLHAKLSGKIQSLGLQLVVRDVSAENEFDGCGFPSTNACSGNFDQTTARVSAQYEYEGASHVAGVSKTEVERENFTDGERSFFTKGFIEKVDYVGSFILNDTTAVVSGVDYKSEVVDVASDDDLDRSQLGVFGEMQLNFSQAFFINAGARYDDNEDFGEHVSVRLSSAYVAKLVESTLKLRSSLGTGFRAPSLSEIAYNANSGFGEAAETELSEERSRGADMGVELYLPGGSAFELSYFYQTIRDEIFFDLVSFSGYLQGDGMSKSRGFELGVTVPLLSFIDFKSNATFNNTEDGGGAQRIRRPKRLANFGFNFKLFANKLTLRTQYRMVRGSENEIFGLGRVELDDYEQLDLSGTYDFVNGLSVFARVDNALNEDYQEVTGFNTAGVAAYAGLRYAF